MGSGSHETVAQLLQMTPFSAEDYLYVTPREQH